MVFGSPRKALQRLGIDIEVVDYVEIDKYAVKSYNAMYRENFEPQDITTWDKKLDVDLIFHGSPCQDFSLAGNQAGGDLGSGTRSSLLYETVRIVSNLKPKYVIWENVKNVISQKHRHNFDKYLDEMSKLGYTNYYQVLNAKNYGIPQNRERVFTISILGEHTPFIFPQKLNLELRLKDMLEEIVDEKYYLSDEKIKTLIPFGSYYTWKNNQGNINTQCNRACKEEGISLTIPSVPGLTKVLIKDPKLIQVGNLNIGNYEVNNRVYSDEGICFTLRGKENDQKILINKIGNINPSGNGMNGNVFSDNGLSPTLTTNKGEGIKILLNECRIRKLTPLECWRLMGFDDTDFYKAQKVNLNSQLYKQAGNSIVVNVLEAIFKELF